MDRIRNPFNPGAGSRPPLLVGRDRQVEDMTVAIQRLTLGRFERSLLLKGLRGVGKTVLLNEFGGIAKAEGWMHVHLEANEEFRFARSMAGLSRRAVLEMSVTERVKDRARSAMGAVRGFVKVHVPAGDGATLTLDFDPRPGVADSGHLDADLTDLLVEVGEVAQDAGTGILLTIDEIQYLSKAELGTLIVALHRISQLALPLLVAGAGLPSLPGLAGEARSYAERLFTYVDVGSLSAADAVLALTGPTEDEGATWDDDAAALLVEHTEGYPYFIQEFGKQTWNVAQGPSITARDVDVAALLAIDNLDRGFFQARIDKTTHTERDYLKAMAGLGGSGPYRSGSVSAALGKRTTQTGPVRDSLIKRGLCYAPRHGEIAFTVPMFDTFIRRALVDG